MRVVLGLLFVLALNDAAAQDYCDQVKTEVSPDKKTHDYTSPFNPQSDAFIFVSRTISNDPSHPLDSFYLYFSLTGDRKSVYTKNAKGNWIEKKERQLVITFTDGSQIHDDKIIINHEFTADSLGVNRYVLFPLTRQNINKFTTWKISKYSLAGHSMGVGMDIASMIHGYIKCMNDKNPLR